MNVRHRKHYNTLDKGLATDWNDDHIADFFARIETGIEFLKTSVTTNFNLSQETSSTATIVTLVNGVAAAALNATGGAGNLSTMRLMLAGAAGNVTNPAELPVLNAAVELGGLTADNQTHEFGLFESADTPFGVLNEGAFFRVDSGILYAVTCDGAAETITNLGAPTQYGSYRIDVQSTSVKFYVNNTTVWVASHATNLPVTDLTLKFTTAQRAGGSNTMRIQAAALSLLRDV